eukprot:scaffold102_cov103-Cylindrotheca_fusiformis.AAC.7
MKIRTKLRGKRSKPGGCNGSKMVFFCPSNKRPRTVVPPSPVDDVSKNETELLTSSSSEQGSKFPLETTTSNHQQEEESFEDDEWIDFVSLRSKGEKIASSSSFTFFATPEELDKTSRIEHPAPLSPSASVVTGCDVVVERHPNNSSSSSNSEPLRNMISLLDTSDLCGGEIQDDPPSFLNNSTISEIEKVIDDDSMDFFGQSEEVVNGSKRPHEQQHEEEQQQFSILEYCQQKIHKLQDDLCMALEHIDLFAHCPQQQSQDHHSARTNESYS